MTRYKITLNGQIPYTEEEEKQLDDYYASNPVNTKNNKLVLIKEIRLQKLQETDFYALQDVSMSNEMKTWRLNLRNIPQDYTTEEEYDLLLARDENGNLTHSVWSKP